MFKTTISLVTLILIIAVGEAQAQVSITYSSVGKQYFSMIIPDDWRLNVGSEQDLAGEPEGRMKPARLISTMPNSGEPLWFGMWVPEDLEKIEGAKEYVTSLGLDLLADVVITEIKHEIMDSMETQYVRGTGNKEGEAMDFWAGFFQLSPDHVAIAIYIGPPEATVSHDEELVHMIQSIKSLIQ